MGLLGIGALVGVCLVAAAAFLTLRPSDIHDDGPRGVLLRHLAVAAIAALLCAVMYLADSQGASGLTRAIAGGSMVFAPAMIWVAQRRVNGRAGAAPIVALALTLATVMAGAFAPVLAAGGVKVTVLLLICAAGAAETFRRPVAALPGARLIRVVLIAYAAFCGVRLALGIAFGIEAAFTPWGAVTQLTTLLGIAAVVLVGIGGWRMAAQLGDQVGRRAADRRMQHEWITGQVEAGVPVVLCTLSLPDLPLIRAAHGAARAESVETALLRAARDAAPAGSPVAVRGRGTLLIALTAAEATLDRVELLRRRFDELTPLVAYRELPEIHITQHPIRDRAALHELCPPRSGRVRFGWARRIARPSGY